MKLLLKTLIAFLLGMIITGAMLFLPAGTWDYPGAWLFMALLFTPVLLMGIVLMVKNPELLRKRLEMKEREKEQRGVVAISGLLLVSSFIVAGLDYRFSWSHVSIVVVVVASVVLLIGYALYAEVLRENTWLSRTIEVQEGQKVISTGLYGIVRHPMSLATLLMFLPMPLILQSLWGLIPFALYPVAIVVRIVNEEKVLTEGLEGYAEYKTKVKYRLIPFVW